MANVHQHNGSHQAHGFQLIYVFKVLAINSCEDCPKNLKKKLLKIHGIQSVEVDARKNLVKVTGSIDSTEIINIVEEWGIKVELVDARETNPHGYRVELNDEDEKEDLLHTSCRHKDSVPDKDSSFRRKEPSFRVPGKDSSFRHKDSSFRTHDKNKGSSHAPEKYEYSESKSSSPKEFPDHVCRDKYCTIHKRDNSTMLPNTNYGANFPPSYRGGVNYNYPPMMNSYASQPPMYGQYGQYYGLGMVPPVAGYGGYASQRQMPRPRADGYAGYFY